MDPYLDCLKQMQNIVIQEIKQVSGSNSLFMSCFFKSDNKNCASVAKIA